MTDERQKQRCEWRDWWLAVRNIAGRRREMGKKELKLATKVSERLKEDEKVEERFISLPFFLSIPFSLSLSLFLLASWQLSRSQTTICLLERSEQPSTYFFSSSSSSSLSSLSPSVSPPLPPPRETLPLHSDSMWEKENQTEPIDRQDTNTLIC